MELGTGSFMAAWMALISVASRPAEVYTYERIEASELPRVLGPAFALALTACAIAGVDTADAQTTRIGKPRPPPPGPAP